MPNRGGARNDLPYTGEQFDRFPTCPDFIFSYFLRFDGVQRYLNRTTKRTPANKMVKPPAIYEEYGPYIPTSS